MFSRVDMAGAECNGECCQHEGDEEGQIPDQRKPWVIGTPCSRKTMISREEEIAFNCRAM